MRRFVLGLFAAILWTASSLRADPAPQLPKLSLSGIYPHLAMYNNEGECGTGAVVPWAGKLWVITYGPHLPNGSSDKLYEISDDLTQVIRPESVGGTPANRLIHRESNQLFIGPYVIDNDRTVRVIPPKIMPGRLTASARHLTDPANKIYYATMEEGFYEVDVKTLAVTELFPDANHTENPGGSLLPGYHGKGAYSGQGRLVYANNGELSRKAQSMPDIASGCLAEWKDKEWKVIRRNQFTDVTGPGGIYGNEKPATDPLWSIGWDHRSLILMLLDRGTWHAFRLPKATHTYDGAHGWNTEWPRIRDIGETDLLMTMHGAFWRFPKTFSAVNTAGIRQRSTYLKVIGDFAKWNDRLVFGCDDTAKSEFLNTRGAKGKIAAPGQSHSNLWFLNPDQLDQLGPTAGQGAVWLRDPVKAGEWSDPFLFAGYERRAVHLAHETAEAVTFEFEVDPDGRGAWKPLRGVTVPANGYLWAEFPAAQKGEWVRVRALRDCRATAIYHFSNADLRTATHWFDGIALAADATTQAGLIRIRGENQRTLHLAAMNTKNGFVSEVGGYELDATLKLTPTTDAAMGYIVHQTAIPEGILSVDQASAVYVDDRGHRWRLPMGDAALDASTGKGLHRIAREVSTERDLFDCHGTFYELPADNAGGFGKVRPIATHNSRIMDFCSYRGLLVLTGLDGKTAGEHIIRSNDGKASLWLGAYDDLWKFGKPVGHGGPWKDFAVKANVASDPYLMNGYDVKRLSLAHNAAKPVSMRIEIDVTGDGLWIAYRTVAVPARETVQFAFPGAFQACWIRMVADSDCAATATLVYE